MKVTTSEQSISVIDWLIDWMIDMYLYDYKWPSCIIDLFKIRHTLYVKMYECMCISRRGHIKNNYYFSDLI